MSKTYYTVTTLDWSDYYQADLQGSISFIHNRDNLTERGLLRILRRDYPDKVDAGTRIERVERAVYAGQ